MEELSKLLKDDDPKVYSAVPKGLQEYSSLYVRYIQIYRKLEDCYDQIVHAQKRIDLRKTLEACIGRILELRHWMVSLNDGSEYFDLHPILKDMNFGSEALEVPHPRFMVDDNNAAIEARRKFLALASEKVNVQDTEAVKQSKMSKEAAISVIQANERGRQSRQRIAELFKIRKMQEEELQHKHSGGEALSVDAAVRKIQALARGFLERCRVRHSAQEELILIGMNDFWYDPSKDKLYQKLKENMERRKSIQALNKLNYDEAFLFAKDKVKELEGQEMREIIQEEINAWLLQNLDSKTGFYPTFPRPDEGGSKYILNPPPKIEFAEEGKDDKKAVKKKRSSVIKKVPLPEEGEDQPLRCPAFFQNHVLKSLQVYNDHWHDKDDSSNLTQKHDPDLLKASLRPLIFEEVHAACSAAGATFINLSPRNTDGKYPGSQLGKMLQMAFKVAKIMAPSIIYIDEAELVFVKDKKKLKSSGLKDKSSRIKKPLLRELALLQPGDRVLLIGTSSKPQDAPTKPPNLMSLFAKKIYIPYPDYASRVMLWRTLLERHGAVLSYNFNLSILAHLSADYSPGSMEAICKLVLTKKRLRKLRSHALIPEELINHFHEFMPLDKAALATLRGNRLENLPTNFTGLSSLKELIVSDNELLDLPDSIGETKSLKTLSLYGNRLVRLPNSIGNLKELRSLWLEGNPLDMLPESLLSASNLKALGVDSNLPLPTRSQGESHRPLQICRLVGTGLVASLGGYFKLQPCLEIPAKVMVVAFGSAPGVPNWGGLLGRLRTAMLADNKAPAFDVLYVVDTRRSWYTETKSGKEWHLASSFGASPDFLSRAGCSVKECASVGAYYQQELHEALKGYKRVVMIGDSMGASAGLLFSPLATSVIAFCPQVDMTKSAIRPGRERDWLNSYKQELLNAVMASSAHITVHCGSWEHDIYQAKLLPRKVKLVVHDSDSHRLSKELDLQGNLLNIIRKTVEEEIHSAGSLSMSSVVATTISDN